VSSQQFDKATLFSSKFEALGGFVHGAQTLEEAVSTVNNIIRRRGKGKVCCAPLFIGDHASNPDMQTAPGTDVSSKVASDLAFGDASEDPQRLKDVDVGVTKADYAVAQTGCLVEISLNDANHLLSSVVRLHIAVLEASNVLSNLRDLAPILRRVFSAGGEPKPRVTLISGPSRTSDIEMKMVMGVHGPLEVHTVIVGLKNLIRNGVGRDSEEI
jgi:L-lactate dehydrogenase complex protein LldG